MMRALLLVLALAIPAASDAKWERAADGCNRCDDTGTYCTAMWCGDGPEVQAVVYSLLDSAKSQALVYASRKVSLFPLVLGTSLSNRSLGT